MDVWKCFTMEPGALSVMTFGHTLMLKWRVGKLKSNSLPKFISILISLSTGCLAMMTQLVQLLPTVLDTLIVPFHSGWTTCSVRDQKRPWIGAAFEDGGLTIAITTVMMQELSVSIVSL